MDERLVTAVQTLGSMNKPEAAIALVSAFRAVGVGLHSVRSARDRFDNIITHARNGTPQLIGRNPSSMFVVISLDDLVDIVQVAAKRQSFGEALDAAGFQPVSGKKIVLREGYPAEVPVKRRLKRPESE
jgi:hypothetical protein